MDVHGADFVMYQVSDMARSIAFYKDTLGLTVEMRHEDMWTEFGVAPTTLALYKAQSEEETPDFGGAAIALAVTDVKACISELEEKGVTVDMQPFESPVCWIASIKDPDGNSVVIHQRKDGTVG